MFPPPPFDGGRGTFIDPEGREKPPRFADSVRSLPARGDAGSWPRMLRSAPECIVASGGRGTLLLRENPPRSPIPPCGRLSASFTVPRILRSAPERIVASGGLGTLRP